jgi:lipopolysaccharide cholinephosphotransferase
MTKFEWLVLALIIVLSLYLLLRLTYPIKRVEQYKVDSLYSVMNCADKILTRHGIPYFITCGTLLGAERDGGLIPWDNDIDLGIMADDWNKIYALKAEFEAVGLTLVDDDHIWRIREAAPECDGSTDKPGCEHLTWLDIFPYIKDDTAGAEPGRLVHQLPINRSRFPKEVLYESEVFPLVRKQFGPLMLPTPKDVTTVLNRFYGTGWRTPIATQGQKDFLLGLANLGGRDVSGKYVAAMPSKQLTC